MKVGDRGWDDCYGFVLTERLKAKRHVVWVVKMGSQAGNYWLELKFQSELQDKVGPDCNGELPDERYFKRKANFSV